MAETTSWTCEFRPPSLESWIYAVSIHATCCIGGALPLGLLLFHTRKYIRLHRLVGAAIAICAAIVVPATQSYIEEYAPNDRIRWTGPLLAAAFGFSTFFKSINAGLNQYPEGADANLSTWLIWYMNLPEPSFAKGKMIRASKAFIWERIKLFVYKVAGLFILLTLLNIMQHMQRIPEWCQSIHFLGFVHIWLLYLFASFCLDFSSLVNIMTSGGMRTEPGFQNPLLESKCFAEAWGIRWDLPVQILLKRAVYIPARKQGFNRSMSAILTFFVSGLLHEYTFFIHNWQAYEPFKATIFFVLMGLAMIIERPMWDMVIPKRVQKAIDGTLPSSITSTVLTLLVSGLFENYFIGSWIKAGWLDAVREMLPHLSCKNE